VKIRNINPLGRVDLPVARREGDVAGEGVGCLEPGEVFEVPDEVGTELLKQVGNYAPAGEPGEVFEVPDEVGTELLKQVGNYAPAGEPTEPKKAATK